MAVPDTPATPPVPAPRGRGWHYDDGYLLNEYLGRVGHTPSWIVEVEGADFELPPAVSIWERLRRYWATPRVVQRNRRRLAFAWPLFWPPPDEAQRAELARRALALARTFGPPTGSDCGVCGLPWEGGPSELDGRARHLCPDCADAIHSARESRPPGSLATWLWCGVAGFSGLLLQLLFHVSWGWTAVPLALIAGWLMGTANGPNFERHPLLSPALTVLLILLFQVTGWTFIFGSELHAEGAEPLALLFWWTLVSLPPTVFLSWILGTLGVMMAIVERRLHRP